MTTQYHFENPAGLIVETYDALTLHADSEGHCAVRPAWTPHIVERYINRRLKPNDLYSMLAIQKHMLAYGCPTDTWLDAIPRPKPVYEPPVASGRWQARCEEYLVQRLELFMELDDSVIAEFEEAGCHERHYRRAIAAVEKHVKRLDALAKLSLNFHQPATDAPETATSASGPLAEHIRSGIAGVHV